MLPAGLGRQTLTPPGQPLGCSTGRSAQLGEDFLSGPKGPDGKAPCLSQVWAFSPPTGQGFLDQGRRLGPVARRPLPRSLHMASPRGLFLFQPRSQCPSLHFLLPLCVMVVSPRAISRPVYPQKERKKMKKPTALSWLNNEEQKAPQLSETKGHSLYCRVSQSRGLAKPQPWEPGLRSPQGPHRPGVPGGPQNVASSLWET